MNNLKFTLLIFVIAFHSFSVQASSLSQFLGQDIKQKTSGAYNRDQHSLEAISQKIDNVSGGQGSTQLAGGTYYSNANIGGSPARKVHYCSSMSVSGVGAVTYTAINDLLICDASSEKTCSNGVCGESIPVGSHYIYTSTATTTGNVGGRGGADAFYATNKPVGLTCTNTRAFASFSVSDSIANMPTNYSYNNSKPIYWAIGASGAVSKLALNWADMLDGSILTTMTAVNSPPSSYMFTFSDASGGLHADNCSGGTSSTGNGSINIWNSTNSNWISWSTQACSVLYRIMCICTK